MLVLIMLLVKKVRWVKRPSGMDASFPEWILDFFVDMLLIVMVWVQEWYTPPKTNMNPKNDGFQ